MNSHDHLNGGLLMSLYDNRKLVARTAKWLRISFSFLTAISKTGWLLLNDRLIITQACANEIPPAVMIFVKFTGGNNLQDCAWCLRSLQHNRFLQELFRETLWELFQWAGPARNAFISNPSIIAIIQIDLFNRGLELQWAAHMVKSNNRYNNWN